MTNSHVKLLRLVRRGKLHEANVLFADIMQQKAADRLSEERKSLMKEDLRTTVSVQMECLECGKVFKSSNTSDPKCPKCGGYDIDLAESRKLGKK